LLPCLVFVPPLHGYQHLQVNVMSMTQGNVGNRVVNPTGNLPITHIGAHQVAPMANGGGGGGVTIIQGGGGAYGGGVVMGQAGFVAQASYVAQPMAPMAQVVGPPPAKGVPVGDKY